MKDEFGQYIISLYKDIPQEVYEGLLSVFCLGIVLFVAFKGIRSTMDQSMQVLLQSATANGNPSKKKCEYFAY